jgi:hypothetical protein
MADESSSHVQVALVVEPKGTTISESPLETIDYIESVQEETATTELTGMWYFYKS